MALLEVNDIHVYYGSIHAVKGVSFEVNEGEIVTLIGANGAGKSTVLNTISGLLHPRSGSIVFNGKDLTGWEAYGTEKWYVDKEGLLVCESGPDKQYGYLATREYYNDFDLTVEFKQLANGNSGVFFRSFVEPPVKVHGWQCEVAPKNCDTAGIYESYGRGWLVQIPEEKESILKEGDWNTLRLRVEGDHVQTWLNGEAMVDIHDAKIGAAQGRIALQIHDGGGIKVQWRNLKLTEL